ncbi:hypothetical protein GCM10028807_27180 [Spirosoma daeguense]
MKFFESFLIALLLCFSNVVIAQIPNLELGVRAGGTFSHGFTTIPSQTVGTVQTPSLENKSNGIGIGYTAGIWARKNFSNFFIQAEVTYNQYLLKQKANVTLDVNASSSLANALPISVQPGLLSATLDAVSESVLEGINVPILVGKRWMDGKLRGYAGPTLIFVQKAEVRRVTSGIINANSNVTFPETPIPPTTGTTNLLNKYEAQNLEVKDITYALEIGAGYTPLKNLDVDIRYALPVGGVYKDNTIKGFLGIASISLGYKLF